MDWNRETLMDSLGINMISVEKGRAVAEMPVDGRTHQPFGFLHGGASVALAETVASVGSAAMIDLNEYSCFGLEINANHIKAKREGTVTGIAEIIHKGKTTMVWEIKIVDEEEDLLCISRCTVAVVPKRK